LINHLNNEYTAHLLAGKALPIKYSTLISQQSTISGNNVAAPDVTAAAAAADEKHDGEDFEFDEDDLSLMFDAEGETLNVSMCSLLFLNRFFFLIIQSKPWLPNESKKLLNLKHRSDLLNCF
jgi:hypothetical protein